MTSVTNENRYDLLQSTRTFSLDADGLVWHDKKGTGRIDFVNMRRVRLISYPNFGGLHFRCYVHPFRGRKLTIGSHHYVRLGGFEDRSKSYAELIRPLLLALRAKGENVEFYQGSTILWTIWSVLFGLSICVLTGYMVGIWTGAYYAESGLGALITILIFLPATWLMMRKGRSRSFDPANPPPELLGGW